MNDTENTAPAALVTADAVTGRKTAKQHPIVVLPCDKDFIQALKEEFGLKNDMEAVSVLLKVATDYRFDSDGNDRFEAEAKAIEDGREGRKRESKLAALERQIAELKALRGEA
jgi:hypothetical protein